MVFRPSSALSVRLIGRRRHLHETDLTDFHTRVERDRKARDVCQFEGDVSIETGVDEASGRVDEESQTTKGALAFDSCNEIIRHTDAFERGPEHELTRVEHEHAVFGNFDQFGEVSLVDFDVDDASGVIAEYTKQIGEANVDGGWLDQSVIHRIDENSTGSEGFAQTSIRENHVSYRSWSQGEAADDSLRRPPLASAKSSAGVVQWQNISFPS